MGGRVHVRRLLTRTLPAVALVLVVALLPSFGSTSVPSAILTGSAPTATIVHLLGDEVAPASLAPSSDRARPTALVHPGLAVVLLALLLAVFLRADGPITGAAGDVPRRLVAHRAVGRAPPRSFARP